MTLNILAVFVGGLLLGHGLREYPLRTVVVISALAGGLFYLVPEWVPMPP